MLRLVTCAQAFTEETCPSTVGEFKDLINRIPFGVFASARVRVCAFVCASYRIIVPGMWCKVCCLRLREVCLFQFVRAKVFLCAYVCVCQCVRARVCLFVSERERGSECNPFAVVGSKGMMGCARMITSSGTENPDVLTTQIHLTGASQGPGTSKHPEAI